MAQRIFIVDDHPLMRRGYAYLIEAEEDLVMCGEAGDALEALDKVGDCRPDLVVIDISLGGMSGLELIKRLQAQHPDLPLLVVSTHDESLFAERALQAGARGYVMKSEVDVTIVEAVRRVLRGSYYVSEAISNKIVHQFQHHGGSLAAEDEAPLSRLTDRELEVFEQIGLGRTTREIADALMISAKTVDSHRRHIKRKLGLEKTTELQRRAVLYYERVG